MYDLWLIIRDKCLVPLFEILGFLFNLNRLGFESVELVIVVEDALANLGIVISKETHL